MREKGRERECDVIEKMEGEGERDRERGREETL